MRKTSASDVALVNKAPFGALFFVVNMKIDTQAISTILLDAVKCVHFLAKNPTLPFVFLSAFVAWMAFRSNRHLTRAKHSIDFQFKYHETENISKAMKDIIAWEKKQDRDASSVAKAMTDPIVDSFMEILNTWERAAIAIRRNVYDGNMLYEAYGTSYIWIWNLLLPFVKTRQEIKDNPKLYKNAMWLGDRWIKRRGRENKNKKKI